MMVNRERSDAEQNDGYGELELIDRDDRQDDHERIEKVA